MSLTSLQGRTYHVTFINIRSFLSIHPSDFCRLCHLTFNAVYLYHHVDPILSSPSENTHTIAKHLNEIFLMNDATIVS